MKWEGVDCIYIAYAMETVTELGVPHNAGNLPTGWGTRWYRLHAKNSGACR